MAKAGTAGTFRLARFRVEGGARERVRLEQELRETLRGTDAVVPTDRDILVVLSADLEGAKSAVDRVEAVHASRGGKLSGALVRKPYLGAAAATARRVKRGEISLRARSRTDEVVRIDDGTTRVRTDLARLYRDMRRQAFFWKTTADGLEKELQRQRMIRDLRTDADPRARRSETSVHMPKTASKVVLLVEDDKDIYHLARTMLSADPRIGWVEGARTAEEGIELCRALAPDLIVLDNDLVREMTGLAAVAMFKKVVPRAKILLCSARDLSHEAVAEPAIDGWLPKSRVTELPSKVAELLGLTHR